MDFRDPDFIRQVLDAEKEKNLAERFSNLETRSTKGKIKGLQQGVLGFAEQVPGLNKITGAVGSGLDLFTENILAPVFGLQPRETQIQTAKDMAEIGARKTVRRAIRAAEQEERQRFTEETLAREGVSSLAELRAKQRRRR